VAQEDSEPEDPEVDPPRDFRRLRLRFEDGERSRDSNARDETFRLEGSTLSRILDREGRRSPRQPAQERCEVELTPEQVAGISALLEEAGLWQEVTDSNPTTLTGRYQVAQLILTGSDGEVRSEVRGMTDIWGGDGGNITETEYLSALSRLASHLGRLAQCEE